MIGTSLSDDVSCPDLRTASRVVHGAVSALVAGPIGLALSARNHDTHEAFCGVPDEGYNDEGVDVDTGVGGPRTTTDGCVEGLVRFTTGSAQWKP